ncbi:DUF4440 domain-containing protein [Scandinavium sp. V105_16]|uniref:DUF4440 domain-containing protein n=1 Tax=Scandinavium lactucae TaxID=3095028 RepID=A0AAJ2S5S8_9ENTR|nr:MULTISPECIES: DUF4440 domain-containing protein [unclassified Scandinavium]MDX6021286.1 DUF4440 domain-containing protein [Scandinavium sp. V105_16]MDX6033017.1 DUF4440 domain-containing protein [Scandinavium sp. V105_12]MDX6041761.1 DUF4440 domain-containing protein [Scandinavium sp. V105_6]MDX6051326.1 DUF4440 domain-containing protein [Scandinavium sp. V105_1]
MTRWTIEIIDAHIAIENWLGRGEGNIDALLARFSPDFTMVTPGGSSLDHAALCQFFRAQGGSRSGLQITVDNIALLAEWPGGAALRYSEKQILPQQPASLRWSTVIFQQAEGKILWRHLHETAQM